MKNHCFSFKRFQQDNKNWEKAVGDRETWIIKQQEIVNCKTNLWKGLYYHTMKEVKQLAKIMIVLGQNLMYLTYPARKCYDFIYTEQKWLICGQQEVTETCLSLSECHLRSSTKSIRRTVNSYVSLSVFTLYMFNNTYFILLLGLLRFVWKVYHEKNWAKTISFLNKITSLQGKV